MLIWTSDDIYSVLFLLILLDWSTSSTTIIQYLENKLFNTFANSTADGMLGKSDTEKTPCREHSFILWDKKHVFCLKFKYKMLCWMNFDVIIAWDTQKVFIVD